MNYYETKQLEDREYRMAAGGVALFLTSPLFGVIAGAFLVSTFALYAVTALFAVFGIVGVVQSVKERNERKRNINS